MAGPANKPKPEPKHSMLHLKSSPNEYLVARDKGKWPDGRLTRTAPPEARLMQALAKRLKAAKGNRTLRKMEDLYGVNRSSLNAILRGTSWPNVPIIIRLETQLDIDLWGDEHRKPNLP